MLSLYNYSENFHLCQTAGKIEITEWTITQFDANGRFMAQIHAATKPYTELTAHCYGDDTIMAEAFVKDVCIAGNAALDGRCFDVNCVCWPEVK
jgi:hypothetical protein